MNRSALFLCLFFLVVSSTAKADKIDKAFQSLKIFNYFDAKQKFEKKLNQVSSPAAYGLAIIYYRQDNPFHNIDSAYRLVYQADRTFNQLKEKKVLRYAEHGFSKSAIDELKMKIASFYYQKLDAKNSISEWNSFLIRNPTAREKRQATYTRDSLSLIQARVKNTTNDFQRFLSLYPDSELKTEALTAFHQSQYREQTVSGTVASYKLFMANYADNPYVNEAQDQVYKLMTEKNSVSVLHQFIKENANNRNIEEAWNRLYQVYMYEYSDERIEQFESEFPDYPFKIELKSDLQLSKLQLFPMRIFNKFGAMNTDGVVTIQPTYESLNLFYEGLALANKDGKFGYINKANEVVIPFQFNSGYDFESGRAVVELKDKYGLIDRTGKIILPLEFDDIGAFSEGLIYAKKNGKYGYYDKFGVLRIASKFSEAFSFSKGVAKVQIDENQVFINKIGDYVSPKKYAEINFFTNTLLIVMEDDYYGIINKQGKEVIPMIYDQISFLSEGMAMIVLDDEIGYIDSLGRIKIQPKFQNYANSIINGQFKDGRAIVKYKGKMGIIDKAGKFLVRNQYNRLGKNSEMISFNKGKLWGFINQRGSIKITPNYQWAESFDKGLAIVMEGDLQGVISTENEPVIPIIYDEISHLGNQFYLLELANKFGLANETGAIVVPVDYQEIRQLNESTFVLLKDVQLEYLYLPVNRIVQQK